MDGQAAADRWRATPGRANYHGHRSQADFLGRTKPALPSDQFESGTTLPDDQRLVVVRRFVEQKSIREIAQELGRSEGAVKQLQFRALETLREQVRKSDE